MKLEWKETVTIEDYETLRQAVGWSALDREQAQTGLDHSYHLIVATVEKETVGMLRIISDGGYMALIVDVMVLPAYQGQGIGSALMEKAMSFIEQELAKGTERVVMVNLMAVKGKEAFYQKFGFVERPNDQDGAGMNRWFNKNIQEVI